VNEIMTAEEINERFPSEWVLVEDPETEPNLTVTQGKVLWHSPNRDELYNKAVELRPKSSAILFTGKPSADMIFIL
jgi:L,D-peptidoglycan transpeptidase YkuD (ErfK/YbiS/YcfS/YnhG family)